MCTLGRGMQIQMFFASVLMAGRLAGWQAGRLAGWQAVIQSRSRAFALGAGPRARRRARVPRVLHRRLGAGARPGRHTILEWPLGQLALYLVGMGLPEANSTVVAPHGSRVLQVPRASS